MEQNNPIFKLFSYLSAFLDKPPTLKHPTSEQNSPPTKKENKASSFITRHELLSEKIKRQSKK